MTTFLPTSSVLAGIAQELQLPPNDPAVAEQFDRRVLHGELVPFVKGWWGVVPISHRAVPREG